MTERFNDHLSRSLIWKWHIQDFAMASLEATGNAQYRGIFVPRLRLGLQLIGLIRRDQEYVVTTLSSVRLAFLTSIAAAGIVLGKQKKDGEVVARSIELECVKPIMYSYGSRIRTDVSINIRRHTKDFVLFDSCFCVGDGREHRGKTTLLYCRAGLKNFSYLR